MLHGWPACCYVLVVVIVNHCILINIIILDLMTGSTWPICTKNDLVFKIMHPHPSVYSLHTYIEKQDNIIMCSAMQVSIFMNVGGVLSRLFAIPLFSI